MTDADMRANRFYVDGTWTAVSSRNAFEAAIREVLDHPACDVTGNQATQLEAEMRKRFLPLVKASALKEQS